MVEKNQLSLCIITKDEETYLSDCLNDMKGFADEILVVSLGSGEHSLEAAKQAGAAVYRPEWENDFSKIKNYCMEHATGKWVLFLQADEVIPPEQRAELKLLLKNPSAEGYLFYEDCSQNKRKISSPAEFLRLIRNRKEYRFFYRSFEYIPDELLYSVQNSGLRITHRGGTTGGWQLEERTRLLKEDVKEHPQDSYVQYLKGLELLNQEEYAESAVPLEQARQTVNWGYLYAPHLYQCLGVSLVSMERYREAEDILTEGFKLFPFYTDLLVLRAELYRQIGRTQEATKDLETCLTLRKRTSAGIPEPEADTGLIQKMLEEIQSGSNQES
jgi:glycosyltransferase involved in cell wall biosynthesis